MITCRTYREGTSEGEAPFDPGVIEACRVDGRRVWLDAVEPTAEELATLQRTFDLHELAIEDSRRWGQRSKVDFYPAHLFLVAHGLGLGDEERPEDEPQEGRLEDAEIHLFAGGGFFLITVRREPLFDFTKAHGRFAAGSHLATEGIGYLLYLLLDEIVDGYLDTVEHLEDLSDDIEAAVGEEEDDTGSESDASRSLARRIFRLRQQVVRFRRLAAPMREAVDLLLETPTVATQALVPYYRDVLDHVIRTLELIDNVRDLLTSARELQLAQVSNRLNVVMKQLSAWAGIILVPTLIAGIYGMNFRHMPELSWSVGYPFALASMGIAAFALYVVFKRKGWLG